MLLVTLGASLLENMLVNKEATAISPESRERGTIFNEQFLIFMQRDRLTDFEKQRYYQNQ